MAARASDKYAKIGFQVSELFDEERLHQKLKDVLEVKNLIISNIYHKPGIDCEELFATLLGWRDSIRDYVGDTHRLL